MTSAKPEPLVLSRRDGAVLTLTLNRPDKSNSLHPDLVKQLSAALKAAAADHGLSVIVITGAGHSFCAGLDLELLVSWTTEQKLAYLETATRVFRNWPPCWHRSRRALCSQQSASLASLSIWTQTPLWMK
jgi:enoyl-CoA hydratase/carnithine racemase